MNVHEHPAKEVLKSFGAPVAKGVVITRLDQAEATVAALDGPVWVVKCQNYAGGRGKGHFKELRPKGKSGVRVSISAKAALSDIQEMFGKALVTKQTGTAGKQVNRLYVEAGAEIDRELYLAVLFDRTTGMTSFVASTEGGMNIEASAAETPERVHTIPIHASVDCFDADAAKIADALQLHGAAHEKGKALFEALYRAFAEKDMTLLEVNPLIVTRTNKVQVLDAKVSFDNNALFRHPDLSAYRDHSEEDPKEIEASKYDLAYVALDGNIDCMVNGAGLAMATMDITKLYGAEPTNFLDVGAVPRRRR